MAGFNPIIYGRFWVITEEKKVPAKNPDLEGAAQPSTLALRAKPLPHFANVKRTNRVRSESQGFGTATVSPLRTSVRTAAVDTCQAGKVKPKTSRIRLQSRRELAGRFAGVGYSLEGMDTSRAIFVEQSLRRDGRPQRVPGTPARIRIT
jgi:hypothetical protein